MKKKRTQTVESTTVGGRREAESSRQRAAEAKRSKGGEGVLGLDHRRARTPKRRRTTLSVESRHRRRSHAHSRAGAWTASCRRRAARDGACDAGFRRGCHRRVDRLHALRKSVVFSRRRASQKVGGSSDGGGLRRREADPAAEKKIGMKHDHWKTKLGFSLWL